MDSWTWLVRQPVLIKQIPVRVSISKGKQTKPENIWCPRETAPEVILWPPHVCTHTYKHINTYIQAQTKKYPQTITKLFVTFEEIDHTVHVMFLKQLSCVEKLGSCCNERLEGNRGSSTQLTWAGVYQIYCVSSLSPPSGKEPAFLLFGASCRERTVFSWLWPA